MLYYKYSLKTWPTFMTKQHIWVSSIHWTCNCFPLPSTQPPPSPFSPQANTLRVVNNSAVLVWDWDDRKHTSSEMCLPVATWYFSHGSHKSGPKARMTCQSEGRDRAVHDPSRLFDLAPPIWTRSLNDWSDWLPQVNELPDRLVYLCQAKS